MAVDADEAQVGVPTGTLVWAGVLWAVLFGYAILRYVVLGPVDASEIPLFIANKSLSFAALTYFALSLSLGRARPSWARGFGLLGTRLVLVHVVATPALFAMGHFEALWSLRGAAVLLLGALAAGALWWQHRHPAHRLVRLVRRAIVAVALLHVVVLGAPGWLTPERWHGGLPPITLLAAAIGAVGLAFGVRSYFTSARSSAPKSPIPSALEGSSPYSEVQAS